MNSTRTNRRAYIKEILDGLREIPGVSPVETYEGTESAGILRVPNSIP